MLLISSPFVKRQNDTCWFHCSVKRQSPLIVMRTSNTMVMRGIKLHRNHQLSTAARKQLLSKACEAFIWHCNKVLRNTGRYIVVGFTIEPCVSMLIWKKKYFKNVIYSKSVVLGWLKVYEEHFLHCYFFFFFSETWILLWTFPCLWIVPINSNLYFCGITFWVKNIPSSTYRISTILSWSSFLQSFLIKTCHGL